MRHAQAFLYWNNRHSSTMGNILKGGTWLPAEWITWTFPGQAQGSWYPTQKSRSGHRTPPFSFPVSSARCPWANGSSCSLAVGVAFLPFFLSCLEYEHLYSWLGVSYIPLLSLLLDRLFPSWVGIFSFFCEHISSMEVGFPQGPWIEETWKPVLCTPGQGPSPFWGVWSQTPFPAGHPCTMKLCLEFPVSFLPHSQSRNWGREVSHLGFSGFCMGVLFPWEWEQCSQRMSIVQEPQFCSLPHTNQRPWLLIMCWF